MNLELTDEQTEALLRELSQIIEYDRYPFSPRIRTLKEIRAKIQPDSVREPLPPLRHYEQPSKGAIWATRLATPLSLTHSACAPFLERNCCGIGEWLVKRRAPLGLLLAAERMSVLLYGVCGQAAMTFT
jgi:hypothetical protein